MHDQEKVNALTEVSAGRRLRDIRFRAGSVTVRGIREGVMSESSPLAEPNIHTIVATNGLASDLEELVVAIEEGEDGRASVGIESRTEEAATNVPYLRELLTDTAHELGLRQMVADPETISLEPEVLAQIGFHALASGDLEFSLAA